MAGDFRNGTTFEMDGGVFRVVEFQHVKPGKGAAFVRTKLKNVITGAVLEKTFNPSDKYPGAEIEKKTMQYLYNDGDLYYFMDNDTYDQMPLNKADLGDCLKYLKENGEYVTSENLSALCNVSTKTILKDIKLINEDMKSTKNYIDVKTSQGLKLVIKMKGV